MGLMRGGWVGLSALVVFLVGITWGEAPGWYGVGPLALPSDVLFAMNPSGARLK